MDMNMDNLNKKFSLDGLKTQLMSLFMLKTSTSTNDDGSSFYKMIYSILTLTVIDNIMASIPHVVKFVQCYVSRNVAEIKILETLTETSQIKKSSMVVDINLTKSEDFFGESILDYITNSENIKSILFQNKRFVLNNKDAVLVNEQEQIYFKLVNESKTVDNLSSSQIIEIYSFKLNIVKLRIFVDKINTDYRYKLQNKLGGKIFYFDEIETNTDNSKFLTFTMKEFLTNRTFNNVVGKESNMIKNRVNFFKKNKHWYDEKGIPYTLGLLLSGPPGGGKTSTIKCVANTMNRHIINVKLHDNITKLQMEHLFFSDIIHVCRDGIPERFQIPTEQRIYVFEDVDCQNGKNNLVLERELKISMEQKMQQSELLKQMEIDEKNFQLDLNFKRNSKTDEELFEPNQNVHLQGGQSLSNNSNMLYSYGEFNNVGSELKLESIKTQQNKTVDNRPMENDSQQHEKLTLSALLNILDGILETPGRIIIMTSNYPEMLDSALIRPGRIDLKITFPYCDGSMIIELIQKFYNIILTEKEKKMIDNSKLDKMTPAEATKILFENFDDYSIAINQIINYKCK